MSGNQNSMHCDQTVNFITSNQRSILYLLLFFVVKIVAIFCFHINYKIDGRMRSKIDIMTNDNFIFLS